jgi:hypothetical protein
MRLRIAARIRSEVVPRGRGIGQVSGRRHAEAYIEV